MPTLTVAEQRHDYAFLTRRIQWWVMMRSHYRVYEPWAFDRAQSPWPKYLLYLQVFVAGFSQPLPSGF
jgi:hypothetical protein